jgi:uncharacterized membrane protein
MLRGLAIFLMVFGHILWDLDYFGIVKMNNIIYSTLQHTVPPLFFLLVGISLVVSKKKNENKRENDEKRYYKHLMVRGLKILGLGLIITIGSILFIPSQPVFFGVLHCIGFAVILSAPFLKYRTIAPLFAILFIIAGFLFTRFPIDNPNIFQLAIGLHPINVWQYTVDYFPLLPWFGIVLLGISIGDILYCGNKRRFRMPDLSNYKTVKFFQWAGKHSLGIYLIHQPIIGGILSVFMLL